jgi:hypothetical protein
MEKFYCKTCPFWEFEPAHKAMKPPDTIIANAATPLDVRLGWCRGDPPAVVAVPVMTPQGPTLAPQFPDRITREDRPGCHHHPVWQHAIAPLGNISRTDFDKQS